jgi:hypothetical protein
MDVEEAGSIEYETCNDGTTTVPATNIEVAMADSSDTSPSGDEAHDFGPVPPTEKTLVADTVLTPAPPSNSAVVENPNHIDASTDLPVPLSGYGDDVAAHSEDSTPVLVPEPTYIGARKKKPKVRRSVLIRFKSC